MAPPVVALLEQCKTMSTAVQGLHMSVTLEVISAQVIVSVIHEIIQPSARMRSEGYSTWSVCLSVCVCGCYHVLCHRAQQTDQKAMPKGSALRWLDFFKW